MYTHPTQLIVKIVYVQISIHSGVNTQQYENAIHTTTSPLTPSPAVTFTIFFSAGLLFTVMVEVVVVVKDCALMFCTKNSSTRLMIPSPAFR